MEDIEVTWSKTPPPEESGEPKQLKRTDIELTSSHCWAREVLRAAVQAVAALFARTDIERFFGVRGFMVSPGRPSTVARIAPREFARRYRA